MSTRRLALVWLASFTVFLSFALLVSTLPLFLGLFGAAGSIAMAVGPISGVELVARLGFPGLFVVSAAAALTAALLTLAVPETLPTPSRARGSGSPRPSAGRRSVPR